MQDQLQQTVQTVSAQVGMTAMIGAALVSMLDPSTLSKRMVLPSQPVLVPVEATGENANPLRREKEESAPHYISYSVSQRTPGRASKK